MSLHPDRTLPALLRALGKLTDNTPGKYCQEGIFFGEVLQELGNIPFGNTPFGDFPLEGNSIRQFLSSLAKAHAVGVSQKPLFDYETGEGWALTPLGALEARIEGSLTKSQKISPPPPKRTKKVRCRSPRKKGDPATKLTIYLPPEYADEVKTQADRLERSISWLLAQAWRHTRKTIAAMPSYTNDEGAPE